MLTLAFPPLQLPKAAEDGDTVTDTIVGTTLSLIAMLWPLPGVPAVVPPDVLQAASAAAAASAITTRGARRRPGPGPATARDTFDGVRSMRTRTPDRRAPVMARASTSSPIAVHHIQGGPNGHNPGGAPGATLNSSLVAAATPRLARPAETTAEPATTMSLRYWPGWAPPGTTSCSGIRADWCEVSWTAGPVARTQDGGTA